MSIRNRAEENYKAGTFDHLIVIHELKLQQAWAKSGPLLEPKDSITNTDFLRH
jgi:hypothetical protein